MKTKDRDPASYFSIIDSFLQKAELTEQQYTMLTTELKRFLSNKFDQNGYVHPIITKFCTDWYREFYSLIGGQDPYKHLKEKSNDEANKILPTLQINSFHDALKVAVKGNQLDYGSVLVLNPDLTKLQEEFTRVHELEFTIDHSKELDDAINNAGTILFLPDNAGEIIFDIPLLKYLNTKLGKNRIYIAGKETPMLNDVTLSELQELDIGEYGTLLSTGSNCFGLHEEDVSIEFKKVLKDADLIIAKGQAYLEFFTEYNFTNVFNITRVKYPIINAALGKLQPHQNAIINSKTYAHTGISYEYGPLHHKICRREDIGKLAAKLKSEGKKIVTVNGSFDIMHLGHIRTLEDAKRQGDVLIVGLNSDSSIKQYKSPFRPINQQDIRAEFMASLDCVDYVFIFNDTVPMPFLEDVKPHVHCNGAEYGTECIEAPTVRQNGGRIHIMPPVKGFSTTKMIERILDAQERELTIKQEGVSNTKEIQEVITNQNGILFAKPAMVHRETYSGRDIIAKNSKFEAGYVDDRNYVPVEWWIMSITQAENDIMQDGEGITNLMINGKDVPLPEVSHILGEHHTTWPLTKILDIGGEPVQPSFSTSKEAPPIPVHIHPGYIKDGKVSTPGKLEAYFFPPVNVPPYNVTMEQTVTRLGLQPHITKEQVKEALQGYGKHDGMYSLCNVYPIQPYDGWTIRPGTIHAPGPWVTFEIQRSQDDFNLASWQLGQRLTDEETQKHHHSMVFKGLQDEDDFIEQVIDWETSTDSNFKKNNYRPSNIIEQGTWGRRMQIFFDEFYGEAIEIQPGQTFTRNADARPFAGIVWSGVGSINENKLDATYTEQKEFLVTPERQVTIHNTGALPLLIYTVFPIQEQ